MGKYTTGGCNGLIHDQKESCSGQIHHQRVSPVMGKCTTRGSCNGKCATRRSPVTGNYTTRGISF